MAGILISGFVAGQMADHVGRKPLYFVSLTLLTILNVIAGFSGLKYWLSVTTFG